MRGMVIHHGWRAARCLLILPALTILCACGSLLKEAERIQQKYEALNPVPIPVPAVCEAPQLGTLQAVYTGFPNWMQYLRNDGSSIYTSSATACDGTETGHYNSCIHAGELRRVPVTNKTSCDGLSASDALAAFKWTCVMVSGVPNMVSGGLADEKFLSDLVDFSGAGSWRPNSVTVTDACGSATTASSVWYANPIVNNFAAVSVTLSLTGPGTIYLFTTNPNKGLDFSSNRTAIVSQPGLILTVPGGTAHHVSMSGNFQWLEATLDAQNATSSAVNLSNARFAVLRGVNIARQRLLHNTTRYCRVGYTRVFDGTIEFDGGTQNIGNLYHHLTISNARQDHVFVSTSNNIYVSYTHLNADYGYSTGNSLSIDNNIVINHTGANFSTDGLRGNSFNDNTFMNILYANSTGTAFTPGGARNTVINLAVGNSDSGIRANSTNEYYSGIFKVGSNTTDCYGSVGTAGISNTCTPLNISDFTLSNTLNLSTALMGRVTAGDPQNLSDASGLASYAGLTDFFRFESRFRAWGRENAVAHFNAAHRGSCTSGNCRIWNAGLSASDNQVRQILPTPAGNDYYIHRWDTGVGGNMALCQTIKGAVWQDTVCSYPGYLTSGPCTAAGGVWQTNLCSTRGLRNAYEILNDGIGNDNGICESNESCVYTPNIGAYQGHGPLVRVGRISDGVIVGVELWRYSTNGI